MADVLIGLKPLKLQQTEIAKKKKERKKEIADILAEKIVIYSTLSRCCQIKQYKRCSSEPQHRIADMCFSQCLSSYTDSYPHRDLIKLKLEIIQI